MRFPEPICLFFRAISWSSLSGIGNSRVAQLTILMPVIGYLVLFNSEIAEWLEPVIPQRNIPKSPSTWDSLFESNLVFLYFGLLVFGLAVTLFNTAAPKQVRKYPEFEEYIKNMTSIATTNVVVGSFLYVFDGFTRHLTKEQRSRFFDVRELEFPGDLAGSFHRVIEEAFKKVAVIAAEHDSWRSNIGDRYSSGSGFLRTEEIVDDMMVAAAGPLLSFREAMLISIAEQPRDVFYIEYNLLESSKPYLRLLVFTLYVVGMGLMAFPTFLTTMIILTSW